MTSRRGFLASVLAATAVPSLSWADAGNPSFLAAAKEADGGFALFGLRPDGSDTFRVPLRSRGHAGAAHPTRPEAVAFARRPGAYALVLDCLDGKTLATLTPPEGQYFNGHGTFSLDGTVLFTVENRAETSEGIIGIWSRASNWRRIGQFSSNGIGPHDLLRMPGSEDLVVANGGLVTELSTGDETRNIATMRASLTYLSPEGAVLDEVVLGPGLQRNSIRHLAVRSDGTVAFAMQWQGDSGEQMPLLGLHNRGQAVALLTAGAEEQPQMKGYAGSIAFTPEGDQVAISSPKGGRAHVFAVGFGVVPSGAFLTALERTDICGLAASPSGMIATDGLGGVLGLTRGSLHPLTRAKRAWDNHIVAL